MGKKAEEALFRAAESAERAMTPAWGLALFWGLLSLYFALRALIRAPAAAWSFEAQAAAAALAHGWPDGPYANILFRMPMSGLLLHGAREHLPAFAGVLLQVLILAVPPVLAYHLGRLLAGRRVGGLAALALCLPFSSYAAALDEAALYRGLVLLVAILLVRRARAPSPAASVLLGAAVGASLLCRSPLFLFPALPALREGLERRKAALWLPLLLAPALIAAPWFLLQRSFGAHGLALEGARADSNIVAGVLGAVGTVEGDFWGLTGLPPGGALAPWVVGRLLADPWGYAWGLLRRLGYVLSLHPLLAALALWACWRHRGSRAQGELALLAAYFFGVHCLMGVEGRYLEPGWLLAAGLAARAAFRPGREPAPAPLPPAAKAALGGSLALAAAVLAVLLRCPDPASARAALEARQAPSPAGEPWGWYLRGRLRLARGEPERAAGDLLRARQLGPEEPELRLSHVWALAAAGRAAEGDFAWEPSPEELDDAFRWPLLAALRRLERGETRRAREAYEAARAGARATVLVRGPRSEPELALRERLTAEDGRVRSRAEELLAAWPAGRRDRLAKGLEALEGASAGGFSARADAARSP